MNAPQLELDDLEQLVAAWVEAQAPADLETVKRRAATIREDRLIISRVVHSLRGSSD